MARLSTNYESAQGLNVICKWAPGKSGSKKVWCVAWLKKVQRKKVMQRKRRSCSRKGCASYGRKKVKGN